MMAKTDPRVDAYIDGAAEFAKPILRHLRSVVHQACPDVEETMKWSMPTFTYHGILCGMAAFKQHVSFGFWKHALVMGEGVPRDGMGSFGKVATVAELPTKSALATYVKKAMQLNADGVKGVRAVRKRPQLPVPPDLSAALKKNKKAAATFDGFSPSCRREYIEWIVEAKREETRSKRLTQAVEWMAEGKVRNWKYLNC
jgi:uncharacterized protein YdeI (YjbR/CyaY-like superfamily)